MPRRTSAAGRERVVVVNARGDKVIDKFGVNDRFSFTDEETRAHLAFATLTHSHPNGSPLSADDVRLAAGDHMAAVRAVTPRHVYEVRPGPRGWAQRTWETKIGPTWRAAYFAVNREARDRAWTRLAPEVRAGRLTPTQATARARAAVARQTNQLRHDAWVRTERQLRGTIIYSRIARPKG